MPAYTYLCEVCGATDRRIGGLDDRIANCVDCGGMMLRITEDIFTPYFEDLEDLTEEDHSSNG